MKLRLNNNGDDYPTLQAQLIALQGGIALLKVAVQEAWPHGRNYQTVDNPEEALEQDRTLFANMAGALAHFEMEVEQARVGLYVQNQGVKGLDGNFPKLHLVSDPSDAKV